MKVVDPRAAARRAVYCGDSLCRISSHNTACLWAPTVGFQPMACDFLAGCDHIKKKIEQNIVKNNRKCHSKYSHDMFVSVKVVSAWVVWKFICVHVLSYKVNHISYHELQCL